ncbi:MAG: nucleotide disphospho-sugar-binding domain-containing protein, partial [Ilumatobacteraceae bacterium]
MAGARFARRAPALRAPTRTARPATATSRRTGTLEGRDGVFEFAPLERVLPRCRAIVHHDGYGTTVARLRPGIPAVTDSPMPDQLWDGRRTAALGAGIALAWRHLRQVGTAIDQVLTITRLRSVVRATWRQPTNRRSSCQCQPGTCPFAGRRPSPVQITQVMDGAPGAGVRGQCADRVIGALLGSRSPLPSEQV